MPFLTNFRFIITGVVALAGVLLAATSLAPNSPQTAILLAPESLTIEPNGEAVLTVKVHSDIAVNAFSGDVMFDSDVFTVSRIDYNTSLADLWVTEPWYSKAENTVYFAGGTTKPGGFTGEDTLLTIYLKATKEGFSKVSINNARVLKHDGLGTDATLSESIDSIFTAAIPEDNVANKTPKEQETWVRIKPALPSPDLNDDGKITFTDLAIMMFQMGRGGTRYDLNQDGKVDFTDFSILSGSF